mmetsp:Transcript_41141/g.131629  ORF Transcript_41141/g.131629 Transcript_41141/m.131629 type:complete len:218 (-) Transcript_41141:675-1328(-)
MGASKWAGMTRFISQSATRSAHASTSSGRRLKHSTRRMGCTRRRPAKQVKVLSHPSSHRKPSHARFSRVWVLGATKVAKRQTFHQPLRRLAGVSSATPMPGSSFERRSRGSGSTAHTGTGSVGTCSTESVTSTVLDLLWYHATSTNHGSSNPVYVEPPTPSTFASSSPTHGATAPASLSESAISPATWFGGEEGRGGRRSEPFDRGTCSAWLQPLQE